MIARLIRNLSNLHRRMVWLLVFTILLQVAVPVAQAAPLIHGNPTANGKPGLSKEAIAPTDNSSCGEPMAIGAPSLVPLERCVKRVFTLNGVEKKIVIYYTMINGEELDRFRDVDMNGDGVIDSTAESVAQKLAEWSEDTWRRLLSFGFTDPNDSNNLAVKVFRIGGQGWCCASDYSPYPFYHLNAHDMQYYLRFGNQLDAKSVVYHEMWHAMTRFGVGGWVDEGSAAAMTDHITLDVDLHPGNELLQRASSYLTSWKDKSFSTVYPYDAALWWTYFMEQIGTVTTEPERGVDAMKRLKDNFNAANIFGSFDSIIRNSPGERTFESLWIDFTVANYTKDGLNQTLLLPRHRYEDELQLDAPQYASVGLDLDQALTESEGAVATADVAPWSARYYQFRPTAATKLINLEFRQDTRERVAYTMLRIRGNELIDEVRYIGRDFVRSFVNDNYDRVVVIVTGLAEYANYRYRANANLPTLNIVDPGQGRRVYAGDATKTPGKILIKVEVLAPQAGGTPIAGFSAADFKITVGAQAVQPSEIIQLAYLQGQYWILLRAPKQAGNGEYALTVELPNVGNDMELNAVKYAPTIAVDNLVIIDRSGSMSEPNNTHAKMRAARDAAQLYIDTWDTDDQIGVVSYDHQPTINLGLTPWNTTTRNQAHTLIRQLQPGGATAIASALITSMDELIAKGNPANSWEMILLSDGMQTAGPPLQSFIDKYVARKESCKNGQCTIPRVHTVALGADADRTTMQRIAELTGGSYHYAVDPAPSLVQAADALADPNLLTLNLAEIYRVLGEHVAIQQQIYSAKNVETSNPFTHTIVVEPGVDELTVVLKTTVENSSLCDPAATIVKPNGSIVDPSPIRAASHRIWHFLSPEPGVWQVRPQLGVFFEGCNYEVHLPYLVEASVKSNLTMNTYFGLAEADRTVGVPMPVLISLTGDSPIQGAVVNVQIINPIGVVRNLALYDDGLHGDGAKEDGLYGNHFAYTQEAGSYMVTLAANGTTSGGAFQRSARAAFQINRDGDSDGDGIPDGVERYYGSDPAINDASSDPDFDGWPTGLEHQSGMDPLNDDTDFGGENDRSELISGKDPNNPADDGVHCMLDFQATNVLSNGDEQVSAKAGVLHFSVDPTHDRFLIWRATDSQGPWQIITDNAPPTGQYIDSAVTLGTTYYYRLQAIHSTPAINSESCILGPRSTTPKEDALAPEGTIAINQGQQRVTCSTTQLAISASEDTTLMLLSNTPDFGAALWEPYRSNKQWALAPVDGRARVYIKFRDGAGNESTVFMDEVVVDPIAETDKNNATHIQTRHLAAPATIANNYTLLRHPLLDNNPDALLLETLNRTPGGSGDLVNAHSTGLWYTGLQWSIFNQDGAAMPPDVAYNLLTPSACTTAFVHRKTVDDDTHLTLIDHPLLNNNPDAFVMASQNWNPPGSPGVYNNHNIGVWYTGSHWSIYNQDRQIMPVGAAFTILLPHADALRFVHQAQASNRNGSQTELSHPMLDNNPNALIYVTQKWSLSGAEPGLYNDHPIGVSYTGAKWVIFNQDEAAMPVGATFNVLIAPAVTGLTATNNGPTPLGSPTTFNATVTAGGQPTYHWDFGDGQTGSGATVQHTYTNPGDYNVTVTATDKGGSAMVQMVVRVLNAPLVSFKLYLPLVQR